MKDVNLLDSGEVENVKTSLNKCAYSKRETSNSRRKTGNPFMRLKKLFFSKASQHGQHSYN